jgi:hypothetical protein
MKRPFSWERSKYLKIRLFTSGIQNDFANSKKENHSVWDIEVRGFDTALKNTAKSSAYLIRLPFIV